MYIMSKREEKNCRLCLKLLDDGYNVIDGKTKEIFEILLLKMDLSVCEEPLLCQSCMESVREAFDFKSTCIAVDKQAVSFAINRNSCELDIRDIYLNKNENKGLVFNEDYNVCRFCLQCLEKNNFSLLNNLKKNLIDEMLLKCIPELDRNIIKEPMICTACMKSLETYYSLTMKCQITEENIMKYCAIPGAECNGWVSLNNVLNFQCTAFKGENNLYQNGRDTYSDINNVIFKTEEELIIKDESKCEDCTTEENKCDETRQKEVINYDMLNHKDSSDVVTFICALCTFETKHEANLKVHRVVHNDNSETTMYQCDLCSYKAKNKTYLRNHMLTHKDASDVVMYKCAKCTFETIRKRSLRAHMLTHKDDSEVNMHKCKLCSFKTKYKNNLNKHMVTHKDSSEIIMYRCETCTYETKYKKNMLTHLDIHKINSEVYKCNLCNTDRVCEHMPIHNDNSKQIMYKCDLCSYQTNMERYLTKHVLKHKDSSMYRCELCSFVGKRKWNFKRHMSEAHSIRWCTKTAGMPLS